ncbi:dioxygenase [Vulgatibacter incomptus]|uniref:Catechol 1,2-dioxygenase 1 n=1 Tax=Vulgatibacter incomptus TaxID=1391653 RepID=A0A0K1PDC5_9BACT|nr:dioxygenase [Vulgatibacter incomptus]AKU91502.1 Catechol 1,2-dioxygenase 1 [Vulgatibacter incomptus]
MDAPGIEEGTSEPVQAGDGSPEGVTRRALEAYETIRDARVKHLVQGLIEHLHACVGELRPTDEEWEFAWRFMERMAQMTSPERNEFLLLADVLGVSQLIEALAHQGPAEVGSALLGPFYRHGAPNRGRGASIASDDTPGDRVRVTGRVFDWKTKQPIAGAIIEAWQASTEGLYENQDPNQPDFNLRGRFRTDEDGTFELTALLPVPYPIPTDGPVGELLRTAGRSAHRPAHIHVIVMAPGHRTFVTQLFREGDPYLAIDPTFTATRENVRHFEHADDEWRLHVDFPMRKGKERLPEAPIPKRRLPKEEVAQHFVGTWRLVDALRTYDDGATPTHVYGEKPIGYIHYDDAGMMSVQLGPRERRSDSDYHAYFGRYEVDADRDLVRHMVEGQTPAGRYPKVLERHFRFSGDLLHLQPVDDPKREIVWQRVER